MRPVSRKEQLIRSLVLLVSCAVFSVVAYFAGAYNLADQRYTYVCIVAIVGVAALVSRLGTKWIMRRFVQPSA
jgi:uncharacterized membrane protein YcjF (UPF0283 family)